MFCERIGCWLICRVRLPRHRLCISCTVWCTCCPSKARAACPAGEPGHVSGVLAQHVAWDAHHPHRAGAAAGHPQGCHRVLPAPDQDLHRGGHPISTIWHIYSCKVIQCMNTWHMPRREFSSCSVCSQLLGWQPGHTMTFLHFRESLKNSSCNVLVCVLERAGVCQAAGHPPNRKCASVLLLKEGRPRGPESCAICQKPQLACKTEAHPARSSVQVLKQVQAKKLPYAPHRSLGMCLFLCEEVESIRQRQGAVCKATVVTQLSKTLMGQ